MGGEHSLYEQPKLRLSFLITPTILPQNIPYITPFKEFRSQLTWCVGLGLRIVTSIRWLKFPGIQLHENRGVTKSEDTVREGNLAPAYIAHTIQAIDFLRGGSRFSFSLNPEP